MQVPFVHFADLAKTYDALNTYLAFGFSNAASVDVKEDFKKNMTVDPTRKLWMFVTRPMNIGLSICVVPHLLLLKCT